MWRSLWRSLDRFSVQHFKYVISELRDIKVVDASNRELVIDLLHTVVEIVTYGDRQNPYIFDCFMENQVLAEFVRVLKISKSARIEAPVLQYLSIMIQNLDTEHAIYYCLSNDYVNNIISYPFNFNEGDLAPYYISFLRSVSSKINADTLCLLLKVHGETVVSFPLYTEALKFAQHGEKMIQTAVRALTLKIYNVGDEMVCQFVTTAPTSEYFSGLVLLLREQCVQIDKLVNDPDNTCPKRRSKLLGKIDKFVDDVYYLKDIIDVGKSRLAKVVTDNLLNLLVFPTLLPVLQLGKNDGLHLSKITTLYIVSRLVQLVGGKEIISSVAGLLIYPYLSSSVRHDVNGGMENSSLNHLNGLEKLLNSLFETEGVESIKSGHLFAQLQESISSSYHGQTITVDGDICLERIGILPLILSGEHDLVLASLFLLLTVLESEVIFSDNSLAAVLGCLKALVVALTSMHQQTVSGALVKVLASEQTLPLIKCHSGWFLHKLLCLQGNRLDSCNLDLFYTSYEQSKKCFQKEIDGLWYDCILDTLRNEWETCRTALEEPCASKDPFLLLDLVVCQYDNDGDVTSCVAWHRMVDAVKVFVIHLQLKTFICKGKLLGKPLLDSMENQPVDPEKTHVSDVSTASFGSEVYIGSGVLCRIAFSNAGIRDIYMLPFTRGTSGKVLLLEKHPFHSQRGIVIAVAPLAGLSPKIDEEHPTWLHLRIREFDPGLSASKTRGFNKNVPKHATADGRWTLGFTDPESCQAAQLMILEETAKHRSYVESILAPLLQNNSPGDAPDDQFE